MVLLYGFSLYFCVVGGGWMMVVADGWWYNHIKSTRMSEQAILPDNAGAAFFGFMGVSMALVLASTPASR